MFANLRNTLSGNGIFSVVAFAVLLTLSGCGQDDDDGETPSDAQFDRAAMLTNIGEQIIIPAYLGLSEQAEQLNDAVTDFVASPDQTTLDAARLRFRTTYVAFQDAKMFEFGPALTVTLRTTINTYPLDADQVESNVSTGSNNLDQLSNLNAKGLPALDYLLYGLGDDQATLDAYTTDANAANRLTYLETVAQEITDMCTNVYDGWDPNNGNYLAEFTSNTGTDVGSSLGFLVNEINFDYELIKNAKVGIPLGIKSLGVALPEQVEAYYSGISTELALANLNAIEQVFLGGSGSGLDDHLDFLDARHEAGLLSIAITQQIDQARGQLENIDGRLSDVIVNDPDLVQDAYTQIQLGVVLLKTDMTSALGVQITYQDSDGD